jgi:hypothetical protein
MTTKSNIYLSKLKVMATKKSSTKKSASSSQDGQEYSYEENKSMLQELFLDELRDIYWAEKHLVKALPKMKKAATSEELATAFEDHLAVTEEQVARLEQVFELLGKIRAGFRAPG